MLNRILCCFAIIAIFACHNTGLEEGNSKKKVLAQAYNKKLYASDLEGILPQGYKLEDSLLTYNAFVENWLRDAVLMHEAEQKIAQNVDIDKLVKDYRSTLILHNYEEVIVQTQLDSVITEQELNQFYDKNKANYHLKDPLVRLSFIKIPLNAGEIDQIDAWWQSEEENDRLNLIEYCNTYAEVYHLNKDNWYELDKIKRSIPTNLLPQGTFNQTGTDIIHTDERYKYYLRILEIIQKNEAPPVDYIKEKARQVILQKRKSTLLEEHRENLYEKEIENVKVFTQ